MALPLSGVILASGEGSRMRQLSAQLHLPKHLFPLGSSSVVGRLIRQMQGLCSEILIITSPAQAAVFTEHLAQISSAIPLRLQVKQTAGFRGDFAAMAAAQQDNLLLTMGDLVFDDRMLPTLAQQTAPNVIAIDRTTSLHFDFRIIGGKIQKTLLTELSSVNPESFWPMLKLVARQIWHRKGKITFLPSLFNLNTPAAYQKALAYFQQHPER